MSKHTVISLDLAKRVIQVAKISRAGELLFNKTMSPDKLREFLAKQKSSLVVMEGCGSCHYWARFSNTCGHKAKIIAPKAVKPYVSGQKTDANDAIGIAVASQQLGMSFCPIKSVEQQTLLSVDTSRKFLDKSKTALNNHLRGLFYEFGIVVNLGEKGLRESVTYHLDSDSTALPSILKQTIIHLWEHYLTTVAQLKKLSQLLSNLVKQHEPSRRLMALEGVGEISAAGLIASLGDGSAYKNGRNAAVYVGATPKQHSSGGKVKMIGISKNGNYSLRSTLYIGALSVISRLPAEPKTQKQAWLIKLVQRAGVKRACIALVNKTVRTAWAMLKHGSEYQPVML
jgi:transposase